MVLGSEERSYIKKKKKKKKKEEEEEEEDRGGLAELKLTKPGCDPSPAAQQVV